MLQLSKERLTQSYRKALSAGFVLVALMCASLVAADPAHAGETFTVTIAGDSDEGNCELNGCNLREAINNANGTPGKDTIEFSIPRAGVQSIRPSTELPAITEAVTIDGYSQFGAEPNTLPVGNDANLLIELDGVNAESVASGLKVEADGVVVRGLVIQRFGGSGISVRGSSNTIEGNFIGTDPSGREEGPGNDKGISIVSGRNNDVGGATPAARNLISGNEGTGVDIFGPVFGTEANKVQGNYIGTDKNGTADLGNGFAGVFVSDSPSNTIGGSEAEANLIAFNAQDGIAVRSLNNTFADTGNAIRSNSIFSNGDLGIDLHQDGPTANDPKDPDTGENDLQNSPVLTSATETTIRGTLNSTPDKLFVVEFFSNPSGEDEGKTFLGQKLLITDANGDAAFDFAPGEAISAGQSVTATATSADRNTSEFSEPVTVRTNAAPVANDDARTVKSGKTLNVSAPGVLKNDSDPDGDPLGAELVSKPTKGTLKLNADGSFSYKPKRGFKKGTDSFVYRISDGKGGTDTARVTIRVKKK